MSDDPNANTDIQQTQDNADQGQAAQAQDPQSGPGPSDPIAATMGGTQAPIGERARLRRGGAVQGQVPSAADDPNQNMPAPSSRPTTRRNPPDDLNPDELELVRKLNGEAFAEMLDRAGLALVPKAAAETVAPVYSPNELLQQHMASYNPGITHSTVAPPAPRHPKTGEIIDADEAKAFEAEDEDEDAPAADVAEPAASTQAQG